MGTEGTDRRHRVIGSVIIRHARDSDAEQFESFDLGDSGLWLDEVAEIVAGLVAWRSDPHAEQRDRQVIVAVTDSRIVGVTAHERLARSGGRVWNDHRYLMVTAVRGDEQRTGLARLLDESVLADLGSRGCESVESSGWCIRRTVRRSSSAGTCSQKPTKHSHPRTIRTSASPWRSDSGQRLAPATKVDTM